ncbi:aspartate aminotransferase family protein [Leeia sp. TBRC 13508]|uniref:Aspartate aminotransferase family protein n=1 Tax=Leeia speluncae TaxID=2884804 RepID=A0ABS8D7I1_9NEIS|nr:aspartate aminotransferase family protein [Leeia speluncae]MCB6184169.1 aspartate aminotransferase family protein [Leeia speluncae]
MTLEWNGSPLPMDAYWMPFTANRQFKAAPRMLVSAQDMHFTDIDGRQILDGTAGLWCVNAGHNRPTITEAVQRQIATLDYAPPFQMGHPQAFIAADRLAKMAPAGLNRVFFTNSGSESADTALKIALGYHRMKGDHLRTKLIGRERGYHGVNFGGISVGGIAGNRKLFGNALAGVDHLSHTHDLARNAFSKGEPALGGEEMANAVEARITTLHDPSTIAAIIVEPVAGSTGVILPPKGYLKRLREICTKHGILLIFDEVITGFGRLGTAWGADKFDVVPDIITCAKGLSNGVIPMGAVIVKQEIHDAYMAASAENAIELPHGYTYSAHPVAAAAAVATLDLYQEEKLFERAAALESHWEAGVHSLKGLPHVKDLRNIGLVAGIELESAPGKVGKRAFEVYLKAWDKGVLIRTTGDIIALSPPLIINKEQIDQIFNVLADVLKTIE